jgi:hypothetical protein
MIIIYKMKIKNIQILIAVLILAFIGSCKKEVVRYSNFENFSFVKIKSTNELKSNDSILIIELVKNTPLSNCRLEFVAKDSDEVKKTVSFDWKNTDSIASEKIHWINLSKLFNSNVKQIKIRMIAKDLNGFEYNDSVLVSTKFFISRSLLFKSFKQLKAFWPLEKDILDYSGNSQNGSSNNGVAFKKIPGTDVDAGYFEGNSNVVISHSNLFNVTEYSISGLIYPESIPDNNLSAIISKREQFGWGNSFELDLAWNSGDFLIFTGWSIGGSNLSNVSSSNANGIFKFNNLLHVCLTHDSQKNIIYVNGIKISEKNSNGFVGSNLLDISIGRRLTNGWHPFKGYIKDVALWGKALSAAEIQQIADSYK